jgi:hypothetical protein
MGHLYGFGSTPLKDIATALGAALHIELRVRESSYRCGNYFLYRDAASTEELIVQENCEDSHGELAEPDFPEHKILLYVSSTRLEEIARLIQSAFGDAAPLLRS